MFEFEIYYDKKILFPNFLWHAVTLFFLYALHKNDSHNFKGLLYLKKTSKIKKIHINNLKDAALNECEIVMWYIQENLQKQVTEALKL